MKEYGKNFKALAYFDEEFDNENSGESKDINWTLGNKQKITLTDDCTLTFIDPHGPCDLFLKVIQDNTGNRTIIWPTINWIGEEPILTSTEDSYNIISLYFDGTNYFGHVWGIGSIPEKTEVLNDHEYQGNEIKGIAGSAILCGQLCYCKLNDSVWKYYPYDASGTDKLILPSVIATEDISQENTGIFMLSGGIMRDDTWDLSGTEDSSTTIFASDIAGGLTMTAPSNSEDQVIVAGVLINDNLLLFMPGYTWIEIK